MGHMENIHNYIDKIAMEVFNFIKEEESKFEGGWVPAAHIKNALELNFVAVPKNNIQHGAKGWFFAIIARMLEDRDLVQYRKTDSRAYYRAKS